MFAYIFQISIVVIVVALSAGYAGWRLHKSFSAKADPCADCPGCALKNQKNRKEMCEKKKHDEKFGRMEKKH